MTDQLTDNEVIVDCIELAEFMEFPYTKITPQYHRDWSALMPVWYKFRDLKLEDYDDTTAHINHRIRIVKAIVNGGPSPLEACKLLAEGIRWYNSTTQNKEQS